LVPTCRRSGPASLPGPWAEADFDQSLAPINSYSQANGFGANAALVEGQRLSVPSGVMKNTHNASTFNP
jgi:hypothetical protein